jgi:hypothetical protein
MKITILLTTICVLNLSMAISQSKLDINYACSYYGEKNSTSIYTFSSDNEAQAALRLITDASGISQNFNLLAADIPNAAAVIMNNKRYILYNQTFMYNIRQRINYWASLSILAHEVGHHLNGHSLIPGGSRPILELEADKFSGFILGRLGANLQQAQSAINNLAPLNSSLTHPGRSTRLAAVANGWLSFQTKNSTTADKTVNTNNKLITLEIGKRIEGGMIYSIDSAKQHGKLFKLLDQPLNYYGFMSISDLQSDWRLPTLEDYELMYQNLQVKGIFEFILDKNNAVTSGRTVSCNSADYWIPNTLYDIENTNCGGSAKTFNFCKNTSMPMPCCPKNNFYPTILVKDY